MVIGGCLMGSVVVVVVVVSPAKKRDVVSVALYSSIEVLGYGGGVALNLVLRFIATIWRLPNIYFRGCQGAAVVSSPLGRGTLFPKAFGIVSPAKSGPPRRKCGVVISY